MKRLILALLLAPFSPAQMLQPIVADTASAASPAFDVGFDFRSSAAFVSDASGATVVDVTTPVYPHTFTMVGTGQTVVAGWLPTPPRSCGLPSQLDTFAQDPRVSGSNYVSPSSCAVFRVDLPSTGSYKINVGIGQQNNARTAKAYLYDSTTLLATLGPTATLANSFMDASGASVAYASWIVAGGAQATASMGTTTFQIQIGDTGFAADYTTLAYLRISR